MRRQWYSSMICSYELYQHGYHGYMKNSFIKSNRPTETPKTLVEIIENLHRYYRKT